MRSRAAARLLSTVATCALALGFTPGVAHAGGDPTRGADYSWYRPTVAQLDDARVGFSARYLVPANWRSGKALTANEAYMLRESGRAIVLNYEWQADGMRGGYAAGVRDAQYAEIARTEVNAPSDKPIYFSADWDVRPWEIGAVLAYLNGASNVLGHDRVGIYGGYRSVHAAMDAGYLWGWQTYAWSYGNWEPRAQLRQISNGALWGGGGDLNMAVSLNYGGWGGRVGGPHDVGRAVPVSPISTGTYVVIRGDTLSAIAAKCRSTVTALAAASSIRNPNLIYPGQMIRGCGISSPPTAGIYIVRRGDTLGAIASRYHTTWPRLAQINHLSNPNRIYPGQRIIL